MGIVLPLRPPKPKDLKFKPYQFPEGFVLIQDTREQTSPLMARFPPGLTIVSKSLKYGDYSIVGFEDQVCIERKGLSDLHSYIGRDRNKTTTKMVNFQRMIQDNDGWVGLAIESSEEEALHGPIQSTLTVEQIRQALCSFRIRYGIHVYFNKDRNMVARWVLDSLIKFYKVKREVK